MDFEDSEPNQQKESMQSNDIILTPPTKLELAEDEIDELLMAPKKPNSAMKASISQSSNKLEETKKSEKLSTSKINDNVMKLIKVSKLSESSKDTYTYH